MGLGACCLRAPRFLFSWSTIGELGRDEDLATIWVAVFASALFSCRDGFFSIRETPLGLAECSGRGEPDEGGVRVALLSSAAKECCNGLAKRSYTLVDLELTLLICLLLVLL